MNEVIDVSRALSDENRVRALLMLRDGELCLCHLIEMLGLAPSTVSKHMSILRQAKLVKARKKGRWIYYSLIGKGAAKYICDTIRSLEKSLAKDKQILNDKKQLKAVRKMDTEKLCAHYKR